MNLSVRYCRWLFTWLTLENCSGRGIAQVFYEDCAEQKLLMEDKRDIVLIHRLRPKIGRRICQKIQNETSRVTRSRVDI